MAKAPKAAKAGKSRQGGGALTLVFAGLGAGVLLSYALPTGILIVMGLLPSALAWVMDPSPGRPGARAVLFANLAALAPTLAELWRGGHGLAASLTLLADWRTLGLAWGGALAGYLLKTVLPLVAAMSVDSQAATRRGALQRRREALQQEWGGLEPDASAAE